MNKLTTITDRERALERELATLTEIYGVACRQRDELAAQNQTQREALQYYAEQNHFIIADENAWDTVSGEPPNLWEDEANTATVEDGSVAKHALKPSCAAAILRQRDARTLREAAFEMDHEGSCLACINEIKDMASKLDRHTLRTTEESHG